MPQFAPAHSFAQQFGVKCLIYGPPGGGKTPLLNTAPRPVLLAIEPGLLSMRGSTIPTCMAETPEKIDDFFNWLFNSREADQYDTVGIDSVSEMSYRYLLPELKKHKDGRKAYGEMSAKVFPLLSNLYYMRNKHAYLIAKQTTDENRYIPQFEGKDLGSKVPHMYDEILHLAKANVPGQGEVIALRAKDAYNILARDRSGKLAEFEFPHLGNLFNKILT